MTKTTFHAGNLLQHSLWTCRTLAQWFDEQATWVKGLDQHKRVIILGGLLHDVGKAGDHHFFYSHKHHHPRDGFAYLCHEKDFYLEDGSVFNFKALYSNLNLSREEQQLLAIFIGMHWEFGLIMKNLVNDPNTSLEQECEIYLDKLICYCRKTGFNNGMPTQTLLQSCIAVSAADVRGVQPNDYINPLLISVLGDDFARNYALPCYTGFDAYTHFEIEEKGLPIREALCTMLKTKKSRQFYPALL